MTSDVHQVDVHQVDVHRVDTHRVIASGTVPDPDNASLLAAAAKGDTASWKIIVDRYAGLIWSVARAHRLSAVDAADVSQATWLRLVERMDDIREPERLGAWLGTVARRESLGVLRRSTRDVPAEGIEQLVNRTAVADPPERELLLDEQQTAVRTAFNRLPDPCRRLLRVLLADPPPSYSDVAAALNLPIGSIGPTRGRCLSTLRRSLA